MVWGSIRMSAADTLLVNYGAQSKDYVALEAEHDHRLLRYVDLLGHEQTTAIVDAVIESQSQPLLYVISADRLSKNRETFNSKVAELRRRLAMRGDAAWLGILFPGKLDIYSTDLMPDESTLGISFEESNSESIGVIPRLANGEDLAEPSKIQLRTVLLGLMVDAGKELEEAGLTIDESIALTGRALFFRFLVGRGIINEKQLSVITNHAETLEGCFGNSKALADTNYWLDVTFNGDLLKLPTSDYAEYFQNLHEKYGSSISRPLSAILGLDESLGPGASQRQLKLGWEDLYFDHVPVGLLSETYEELMQKFDPITRHQTSVYYTPSHIAEYMVSESLYQNPKGSYARVLDPACGAGVFLTAAYRRLAQMRFEETGIRPQRDELRQILNLQLTGFDINSHARMLASLALYLTALELDPHPAPLEDLIFTKLEGNVLINVVDPGHDNVSSNAMVGSIGNHVSKVFRNAFDLVIGNPPWTSLTLANKSLNKVYTNRCQEVALERGFPEIASEYENPDNVPDLPFLWCAMQWAKENGRICFALAGRFLFKRSGKGLFARQSIFRALSITGILNGAALRKTNVWPNVSQHFCLLFADNSIPESSSQFIFVSPEEDPELNRKGRIRIDASDAEAVGINQVLEEPTLFKSLFRGSARGGELIKRLTARADSTVGEFWTEKRNLRVGQGFHVAGRANDDSFLEGLPKLTAHYKEHPFLVKSQSLPEYQLQGLWRPRNPAIYKGPLVLLREATRPNRSRGRALYSESDLAYQGSFYGFSAAEHPDGKFFTKYLFVLVHSALFEYYQLMTSSKFGIERDSIQVFDVKEFPLISPETFNEEQRQNFENVAETLINNEPDWDALDQVVFQTYRLSKSDSELVLDTLATRSPFSKSIKRGLTRVSYAEEKHFRELLCSHLNRVLERVNVKVHVESLKNKAQLPWLFLKISSSDVYSEVDNSGIPSEWLSFANDFSVSRITLSDIQDRSVTVGILNRYRYWTPTQARMLATDIIWQFGAMLEGSIKE